MYSSIILDIDGTILDNNNVLISSLQKSLEEILKIERKIEDLEFMTGIDEDTITKKLSIRANQKQQLLSCWSANIKQASKQVELFPLVEETLINLKKSGTKLGIVTSKRNIHLENDFNDFNLNKYFDIIVTSDDTSLTKPNPEPLEYCLKKLKCSKKEALFIGDSINDLKCANSAHVDFALAGWGARDKRLYSLCSKVLNSFSEIQKMVFLVNN